MKCVLCSNQRVVWEEPQYYFYGKTFKLCEDCLNFFEGKESKHFCSKCKSPFIPRFKNSHQCYRCWKKSKQDPTKKFLVQTIISRLRKMNYKQDTKELQQTREKWINKISFNPDCKTLEMYPCKEIEEGAIKTKPETPQFFEEYKYHNTRLKFDDETILEFDKVSNFNEAIDIICSVSLILLKRNIHYCIFYAEGQRSPHIRIYDIKELRELDGYQRKIAQGEFWREIIPFYIHLADFSVWEDKHFLPLEFSIHWKYGTPYNLIYEFVPEVEK